MNGRINVRLILYVLTGILGAFCAFTNLWFFLLEGTNSSLGVRPLLFFGLGVLLVISAIVQIRRELKSRPR